MVALIISAMLPENEFIRTKPHVRLRLQRQHGHRVGFRVQRMTAMVPLRKI